MKVKKQILIIDDSPTAIQTMKTSLQNAGFSVISALSGKAGLEKVRLLPDLILLDLMMPEMDGHEVCRRLKQDKLSKFIPVIMLTAKDETLDKVEGFNRGIVDYICKEVSFLEVLARINAALKQSALIASPNLEREKTKKL